MSLTTHPPWLNKKHKIIEQKKITGECTAQQNIPSRDILIAFQIMFNPLHNYNFVQEIMCTGCEVYGETKNTKTFFPKRRNFDHTDWDFCYL